MPTIKPFRDYSEHEVLNLYAYSGTLPVTKGTFVKAVIPWNNEQELNMLGAVGASYPHAINQRYGVGARVTTASSGEATLGMLLWDVRETDENGYPLKFNPSKAAAMHSVISGQAVPILRRGTVLYSGIVSAITATNTKLYTYDGGVLCTTGDATSYVGYSLGAKDTKGYVLVQLDL